MKLLYREDVEEAGYDLPAEGLCANIGNEEMQALKFGGEWVLARDEVLVSDGHEQKYLYMVVNGQVGIYKGDASGKSQQIATLGEGAAFGEMAFLSGGVASASVQAIGECILWRMDHERLIEFIGQNGFAGGQLCLNVAGILSGRLVEGNHKVLQMGQELQESLLHLQSASAADQQKSAALKQMQGKVASMQNAFKGSAVKKSGMSPLAMVAFTLAGLSTAGMIALFVSIDDSAKEQAVQLAEKVEKLEKNESFYLDLKKRLEGENNEMVEQTKSLILEKEDLEKQVSRSDDDLKDLRDEIRTLERELSNAKDDIVRAQRAAPVRQVVQEVAKPEASASYIKSATEWAKTHVTLAFPSDIIIVGSSITLTDRSQKVKVPVKPGGELRAVRFHPTAPDYLVVAQKHSDKLLATIRISNSNFIESISPKYVSFMKSRGENIKNPYEGKSSSSYSSSSKSPAKTFEPLSNAIPVSSSPVKPKASNPVPSST
ncbi:MAG: cyclic nucleotide-binding domain-containing protein, partial [Opitutales bacterium]